MAVCSNLPPLSSKGVFQVSVSVLIDAPRDKVWNVLLDLPKYHEWNPFVRCQTVVSKIDHQALEDQTLRPSEYVLMSPVHIPPTMDDSSVWVSTSSLALVTVVDHENYRYSWKYVSLPRWLLSVERWVGVSTVLGGGTKYESMEVFKGIAAIFLRIFIGKGLKKGFVAMGEALKTRCEET